MLANMFVDVYFNLKATTQTRELAHMTAEVFIVTWFVCIGGGFIGEISIELLMLDNHV